MLRSRAISYHKPLNKYIQYDNWSRRDTGLLNSAQTHCRASASTRNTPR